MRPRTILLPAGLFAMFTCGLFRLHERMYTISEKQLSHGRDLLQQAGPANNKERVFQQVTSGFSSGQTKGMPNGEIAAYFEWALAQANTYEEVLAVLQGLNKLKVALGLKVAIRDIMYEVPDHRYLQYCITEYATGTIQLGFMPVQATQRFANTIIPTDEFVMWVSTMSDDEIRFPWPKAFYSILEHAAAAADDELAPTLLEKFPNVTTEENIA